MHHNIQWTTCAESAGELIKEQQQGRKPDWREIALKPLQMLIRDWLARIHRFQSGKLFSVLLYGIRDLVEKVGTLIERPFAPSWKRSSCCGRRCV